MKKLALTIGTALFALQAQAAPEQYEIDPGHFVIQFKVPHLGYSYVIGTFNDLQGTYTYDSDTGEISNVDVTVNTESLDTDHGERNKHLRGKDFLNTSANATATFKSTGWADGQLSGELTVNGETQEITLPITKIGEGEDPWGNYRTGFETSFDLDFNDYGIPDKVAKSAEIYVAGEGVKQ
ncbi:YceI family protein [Cardiobacteriaceae bacterium TAE3-ERU3]|nr:YceI family protein [Cardiobacteriaceae bacterium TAE3-ERU3]